MIQTIYTIEQSTLDAIGDTSRKLLNTEEKSDVLSFIDKINTSIEDKNILIQPKFQDKITKSLINKTVVKADEGFNGLSQVTVEPLSTTAGSWIDCKKLDNYYVPNYGEELVSNGSFDQEDYTTDWVMVRYFERITDNTSAATNYALKYNGDGNNIAEAVHSNITVKTNTWYELSASFYRSDDLQWIYVDFADIIGEPQLHARSIGQWERKSMRWYSGDVTNIRVRCVCEKDYDNDTIGSGDYYVDDVSLKELVGYDKNVNTINYLELPHEVDSVLVSTSSIIDTPEYKVTYAQHKRTFEESDYITVNAAPGEEGIFGWEEVN